MLGVIGAMAVAVSLYFYLLWIRELFVKPPEPMVEDVAMVGPVAKIRDELLGKWSETVITTLLVSGDANLVRLVDGIVND